MKWCVAILVLNLVSIHEAAVNEISCEQVKDPQSDGRKQCWMDENTVINSPGFIVEFPRDEKIVTIRFAYNKKIEYLPQSIHDVFPALETYDSAACAIRNISKTNFANLWKISAIYLDGNLIEVIEPGTFDGLSALKTIYMSYNRIRIIDAKVFNELQAIQRVDLFNNVCINDDFNNEEKLRTLNQTVADNCQVSSPVRTCEQKAGRLRVLLELMQDIYN